MPIDTYKGSVGDIIRKLRCRVNTKGFGPLSQLDLALKIGWENPSTLSRIESGKVIPSRKTLIRICKALELTIVEINFLLKKFGYDEYIPHVNSKYLEKMIKLYKKEVDLYPFPSMLEYSRKFIYTNDKVYKFFLQSNERLKRASLQNISYLEMIFFPEYGLRNRLINWKELAQYLAINTNILLPEMVSSPNLEGVFNRLVNEPSFRKMFKSEKKFAVSNLRVHHVPFVYEHPDVGKISFSISQFPLLLDNRFYIMQFIPTTDLDVSLYKDYIK